MIELVLRKLGTRGWRSHDEALDHINQHLLVMWLRLT